jgi:hypothetical protein
MLPSSAFSAAPPTQAPAAQESAVVHASPSSQEAVLFVLTAPVAGSQLSSVQMLPSSALSGAPPTQTPPPQVSAVVQASPSSQAAVLFVFTTPVAGSQLSSVQTFPSSAFSAAPPTQTPAAQESAVVQASPSSQEAALLVLTAPVAGSQLSSVQTFPSSTTRGAPPTQTPAAQVSVVVHASASSQAAVLFVLTAPVAGSQLSSVQTFP